MPVHYPAARLFTFSDLKIGQAESFDYTITPAVYENFLNAFADFNPVHVDEKFAQLGGFAGRVMHGSILNGFISHFIGMHFPGRLSLLLAVDIRYANPSYLGDVIRLNSIVNQLVDTRQVAVLDATLTNVSREQIAARARITVMIKSSHD